MFPTCPACKQSVLDDDVENCPFCGANMKTGKGGNQGLAQKAAPKPVAKERPSAASAPAAAAPAPKSAPTKSAPAASKDDDDPFGVDAAANSRAIPLSPRPAKGKTVRLVCPMCETPGFAAADAAGKEVKCCNEQCALPIFTAPKTGGAVAGADPRTPATAIKSVSTAKKTSPAMILTAVSTLVLAGGSLWYFVLSEPGGIKPPPAIPAAGNQLPTTNTSDTGTEKVDDKKAAATAKPRGEELRAAILPVLVTLSQTSDKNRSKHFCRRLTAEAYVEAGDLKTARENIDQLLNLTPKLPFHQVPPLTQIAWRELSAGNADGAKAALDSAWKTAPELPAVSRLTFDATTDLAAALFASGRADDAQSLMKKENMLPSGSSATLAALSRRARLSRSFDLEESSASLPIIPWKSPQWVVTTITLVLRGHADKGAAWIKLCPDAETKAECWAAWGDAVVALPNSATATKDDTVTAAVRDESPATQARVWARVAVGRLTIKQKDAANRALTHAATAMKAVPLPEDFVIPEMKDILKLNLADAVAPKLNAIASAEVARAQTLLGQTQPATESLAAAMQHLRGNAPSSFAATRLFEATSRDVNSVKAQLKTALNLKTDDKVVQALTTYRAKCRSIFDAANARFSLQTDILKAAVDWPLLDAVWNEATARAGDSTPPEAREEFLKTNLSVRLGQRLRAAGEVDQARQCESAVTTGELTDARDALQRETAEAAGKGEISGIADKLGAYQPAKAEGEKASAEDTDWPLLWELRLACRLAQAGQTEKAFDLVGGSKDMLWREEGFEMLAAIIAKNPVAAEPVWKKYRPSLLSPTEKVAIFRGLCEGLSTSLATKP